MLHSLDRQKIILNNLKNGSVTSINHLIKSTNFNQSTIRRDIKVLEKHKKVIVVRGGIIPVKNVEINPIKIENLNEKQKIAQQAASLIFTSSGPTSVERSMSLNFKSNFFSKTNAFILIY